MKSLFCFLLIVFSVCVFAQDYNIKNKDISVTLTETRPNNLVFSEISNLKTGKNMIVRPKAEDSLWMIEVRKGTDEATKLELFPENADFMNVTKSKDTLKMVWENVKKGDMDNGFDVYATCRIKGIDSFWNIKIKTHSKDYSIWSVKYPNVTCIDAKDANVTYPLYGGMFDTNFHGYYEYAYPSIWYPMQWTFVTKGDTTLYMAAQDTKGKLKYFSGGDCGGQQMIFYVRNTPEYMGEAGHDYDQEYDFVLSPIEGDWYDAAKKCRKWGIDSKFIPFSRGPMETEQIFHSGSKNFLFGSVRKEWKILKLTK
ncbi:MAG: hypothetical protein KBT47_02935 [Armatimonadetes bacterium]|nr:hypothetical protein [Candidatus Hippobium faecium]